MSVRRHAVPDSASSNKNSNLTSYVEELPRVAHCQEGSPVAPLRAQLALEYRLQSLCQTLLESYKDQKDWAAVGQVAQSLVTNTQRVSLLKERLLSGSFTLFDRRGGLQSITEQPCASGGPTLLSLISEADDGEEGAEEAVDATGTESGSESISVRKAFESLTHVSSTRAPAASTAAGDDTSESDASGSAVDYETASQRTSTSSEAEGETNSTGLESLDTVSKAGSEPSLVAQQLSGGASSNTPSPEHPSSCSIECSTPPLDLSPQDLPPQEPPPETNSRTEAEPQSQEGGEGEGNTRGEEGEPSGGESVMETLKPEAVGGGGGCGAEEAETNYVEMHLGDVRTKEGEGEGEGGGESSDSGVEGTLFHGKCELFAG